MGTFFEQEHHYRRANVRAENLVNKGDKGKAVSAIRGYGKARINGELFEVKGVASFIDAGTPVEVVKVSTDRIYVQEIVEENSERTVGNSSEEKV